ncbi:MAG: hypothetical protein IT286_00165 [Proteobacteria bacterium]|jgi:hypothetical protein|nr:hypothetical protein [Pseudomonadota bacterium]
MQLGFNNYRSVKAATEVVGIPHFVKILTLILLTTGAQASVIEKADLQKMTRDAKQVQIGEVVSTWVSPDPDQKMYFTFVKIKVEKTLKGNKSQEILLRQPGGSYKDPSTGKITRQKVFGMDSFKKGEKALFFITQANDGAPTVMFQGKHQIIQDKQTGEETVVNEKSRDVIFSSKKSSHVHDQNCGHDHEKSFFAAYDKRPLNETVADIQKAVEMEKGESTRR